MAERGSLAALECDEYGKKYGTERYNGHICRANEVIVPTAG